MAWGVCTKRICLFDKQSLLIVTRAGPSVFFGPSVFLSFFFVVAVVLTAGKAWPLDGTAGVEGGQLPPFLWYSVPQMEW